MRDIHGTTVLCVLYLFLLLTGCRSADVIVVGSKNFTEQVILGELLAQHIEKEANLKVDRRLNLGGTFICNQALRAGQIDVYVEYTGTAFTAILKHSPMSDPKAVYQQVKQEYHQFGIEWVSPLGFNNTFAILIREEDAQRFAIETVSEASRHTPAWVAGFGYEFIEREDGFKGLSETYALQFAEPPTVMELGLVYRALAENRIDLTAGDSTNGLIAALDLFVLEDDKRYFPPYDAAPIVRQPALDRHPELRGVLEKLGGTISEEAMRRMNYEVDGERKSVKEVVARFLRENIGQTTKK